MNKPEFFPHILIEVALAHLLPVLPREARPSPLLPVVSPPRHLGDEEVNKAREIQRVGMLQDT